MDRLQATVALLARYGISSLIDMHQDVYNEAFGGEGAPNWAVCTDGITPKPTAAHPELERQLHRPRRGPGLRQLLDQRRRRQLAGRVRRRSGPRSPPASGATRGWSGYDPYNEPYGPSWPPIPTARASTPSSSASTRAGPIPGLDQDGQRVTCPPDDPEEGLIPRIEAADPTHLVAYEGNYGTDSGVPNNVGAMNYPRLVLNFHDYCFLHVPNGPEPPNFGSVCGPLGEHRLRPAQPRTGQRRHARPARRTGLAAHRVRGHHRHRRPRRITSDANANLVGWIYWQWINYDDPTGSHSSALWPPRTATPSQLHVLSETYASAVAGTPTSMSFDPTTGAFSLHLPVEPVHQGADRDRRPGGHPLPPRVLPAGVRGPEHLADAAPAGSTS